MYDEQTAELIITADGAIEKIVFVEELVANAPHIPGWKITACKQPMDISHIAIKMNDYSVDKETLSFYPNILPDYPDEIDITIICQGFKKKSTEKLTTLVYIFLDNYLGELRFATTIDNLTIVGPEQAEKEGISIEKLDGYLQWREKEFVEKYEGLRYNTENDIYSTLEATLPGGKPLMAMIDSTLLRWDSKASHPWIITLEFSYDGSDNNGLPNEQIYQLMETIESEAMEYLPDFDGNLNLGRKTGDGNRQVFFACKDFRKPAKVAALLIGKYVGQLELTYSIYKDKYWAAFESYYVD